MTEPDRKLLDADNSDTDGSLIEAQLSRLVASQEFSKSPRLQQLLGYLVSETLNGRSDRIKGLTIAQDIFGQTDPEVAQASTVVSVEARRLRRKIADYYKTEGTNDPIVIEIPKGTFVPVFIDHSSQSDAKKSSRAEESVAGRQLLYVGLFLILALATILAVFLISQSKTGTSASRVANYSFAQPAVAVMPFRNSTGSLLNDGISDGLTEDITTDLARLHEIDVISYSSVSLLTNLKMTSIEIGDILGVSHVLQGSIRGDAPNIRVTAELLDARTGKLIWANRLDRNFDDPLATQNEISAEVIEGMTVGMNTWKDFSRKARLSADPEAAALFEQAMELANPPSDLARLEIAQLAFNAVIDADPSFSGGYAGLAYIGAFKALWGHVPDSQAEAITSATWAQQALDIDPESSLALDALALSKLVLGHFDAAVQMSEKALEVAPNDPYAHSYHAFILTANGQSKAAIPFAKRAVGLDPLEPRTPYRNILGVVQLHAGNYAEALHSLQESERKGGPRTAGHTAMKAAAYVGLGDLEKASDLVASLPPGFVEGAWLDWLNRSFRFSADALRLPELLKRAY